MSNYVIDINKLSKIYRGKKGRKVEALIDLDMQVAPGEIYGFLGPNGAGKSTTIKTLVGLISPTSGEASLMGLPVADARSRQQVGYLPENPAFYDFLSARDYLAFVGKSFAMDAAVTARETDRVLAMVLLSEAADRPIRGYSKGMVQRLGLAQTLLHNPDLYILDEPMSGLDPLGRALVKDIILDLKKAGKTVFFSTHITSDVERTCDRMAIIVDGRLRTVDNVEAVLQEGVEGYRVIARNLPDDFDLSIAETAIDGDRFEFQIEKARVNQLMERLGASDATIELVEPQRRDLEQYFLNIVDEATAR